MINLKRVRNCVLVQISCCLFGDCVGEYPGASVPRPDLLKRAYMLGPLADLAPGLLHPTLGASIAELWAAFDKTDWQPRLVSLA